MSALARCPMARGGKLTPASRFEKVLAKDAKGDEKLVKTAMKDTEKELKAEKKSAKVRWDRLKMSRDPG